MDESVKIKAQGNKISGEIDFESMKIDRDGIFPRFKYRIDLWLVMSVAAGWSIFQLYTAGFGVLFAIPQRSIHATFLCVLVFFLFPASSKLKTVPRNPNLFFDRIPAILTVLSLFYLLWNLHEILNRAGMPTQADIFFGAIFILMVLEATRRSIGPALVIVCLVFLFYAYFGRHIPYPLDHRGFDIETIVSHMFITTEGLWGVPAGVSATFVYIFIAFGAFLEITGAGRFFIKLAFSFMGHMRGGPAKAAVIASACIGSVSGSAVANVVTSGSFTIPLMKATGLSRRYSAAVEACASSGGQLVPPIMGAAAYIMAVYTETPFIYIILAAIIPASLYFLGVFMSVHFHTLKEDVRKIDVADLPKPKDVMKEGGQYLAPLILLIVLLVIDWTPTKAGFYASIFVLVLGFFRMRKQDRLGASDIWFALLLAARNAISVAAALLAAGIVVGVVSLTGMGLKFANMIEYLAMGNFFLTLFFTMVTSIILGMGLPTSACYVVLAILAAPILTNLGVPLLAAHFFILYFGVLSAITPPVAIAAYAGAGISGAKPFATAMLAIPLALSGFIIPYWFVYDNSLMLYGPWHQTVLSTIFAILGVIAMSAMTQGYLLTKLKWYGRLAMVAAFFLLFFPSIYTRPAGVLLLIGYFLYQKRFLAKHKTDDAVSGQPG